MARGISRTNRTNLAQSLSVSGTRPGTMPSILRTNKCSITCFAAYDGEVQAFPLQGLQVDLNSVSTLLSTSSANSFRIRVGVRRQSSTGLNRRHRVQDLYQSRSRNHTSSFRSGPYKYFLSMRSQRVCPLCIQSTGTRHCTPPTSPRQEKLPGIHLALPAVPV